MMPCDKQGYLTREAAMKAIREIAKRDKQSMHVYRCPDCQSFHAATSGKKKHIPVIKHKLNDVKQKEVSRYAKKKPIKPVIQLIATEKLISKATADHLKRLINGNNNLNKQRNK